MTDVVIGNFTRVQHNDRQTISGHIDLGEAQFEIWYKVPNGAVGDGAASLLALTLLPAMRLGKAIRVNAPLSPRLLSALPTIQEILHAWDPRFKKVAIHAQPGPPSPEAGHHVGLFFSGGLDSFYSLLKRRDEVTRLIFVPSFDVAAHDPGLRKQIATADQPAHRRSIVAVLGV